ncbi:MAG: adenylate kinase [Candidatus Krumholzibacteriia bacterium]
MALTHIVILGPPGSGKGTQAARIAREFGLAHLSTGDMLRDAVARKTDLGVEAETYMERGLLVSDEIIFGLIGTALDAARDTGWIMDGFPRNLVQAEMLSKILEERGEKIDYVLDIDVDSELIVRRLSKRRVCPACKVVYNLDSIKTKAAGICDACGGAIVKRPDDEEDTVRRRLAVYKAQTAPVIDYFRKRSSVITVEGAGDIEEIFAEIRGVLK